jgi:hypothetical protein
MSDSSTPRPAPARLRVFLCHATVDKPDVRDLYTRLEAEHMDVWFDEESLLGGKDWRLEIQKAVRQVDAVIVCLSPESTSGRASYLQEELKCVLEVAEEQVEGTIFLIPLKLRPCQIPETLERWQAVTLYDDRGFERLMRSLRERGQALGLDSLRSKPPALPSSLAQGEFVAAAKNYESWLRQIITVVEPDLERKHEQMKASMFAFFRASYFRWAGLFPVICPDMIKAPSVLSVGDLHVSNFGTWRDRDGRLAWGVNDFDEAAPLPFTNDLVRLAASGLLIVTVNNLKISPEDTCEAILEGYRDMLDRNGRPFIISEKHGWLRSLARDAQPDPEAFWEKLANCETVKDDLPESAKSALEGHLPSTRTPYRVVRRVAGVGSLGRQRFVAIADWAGGRIAREVKALTPPATSWINREGTHRNTHYAEVLNTAVRARDLCADVFESWIVRRLAPDTTRIEVSHVGKVQTQRRLLKAMGREAANVHLGTLGSKELITNDLAKRPINWLLRAAEDMIEAIRRDWWEWRRI